MATTYALTRVPAAAARSPYAVSFLAKGRSHDSDCSRSSARLAEALRILADVQGATPVTTHSTRMVPSQSWYRPEGQHACGMNPQDGTECVTRWTAPVSTEDLVAAWELADMVVRERAAAAWQGYAGR